MPVAIVSFSPMNGRMYSCQLCPPRTLSPFANASFAISCSRSSTAWSCCQPSCSRAAHAPLILPQLVALEFEAAVSWRSVTTAGLGRMRVGRPVGGWDDGVVGSGRRAATKVIASTRCTRCSSETRVGAHSERLRYATGATSDASSQLSGPPPLRKKSDGRGISRAHARRTRGWHGPAR